MALTQDSWLSSLIWNVGSSPLLPIITGVLGFLGGKKSTSAIVPEQPKQDFSKYLPYVLIGIVLIFGLYFIFKKK